MTSGGTEIVAIVSSPAGDQGSPSLLLRDIPRTSGTTAVSAHCLLHTYLGGPSAWFGRAQALDDDQQPRLQPPSTGATAAASNTADPAPWTPTQQRLLEALGRDGRASYADLATATGRSPATVARLLAELRAAGAIFFEVDIDDAQLGVGIRALLWIVVAPASLDHVGRALAGHPELAFVAATTGRTNLVAQALCPDPAALHRYLTGPLATLDAIRTVETTPSSRRSRQLARERRNEFGLAFEAASHRGHAVVTGAAAVQIECGVPRARSAALPHRKRQGRSTDDPGVGRVESAREHRGGVEPDRRWGFTEHGPGPFGFGIPRRVALGDGDVVRGVPVRARRVRRRLQVGALGRGAARRDTAHQLTVGLERPHRVDEARARATMAVDGGEGAPDDTVGDLDEPGEVGIPVTIRGHAITIDAQP